jgi:hypothetical protein
MPHYSDGTEAKAGDIVRGKGYNIKNEAGELAEITAVVLTVTPDAQVCNVSVLVPEEYDHTIVKVVDGVSKTGAALLGRIEYGQADHFEKV